MIRVGFVGTGGFTRHHVEILRGIENVKVVGFVGSSQEKAEHFAKSYDETTGYKDVETMLSYEQLDAVYICVPPMAHENYEEILVDHGIPFLVEKPLGIDVEKVRSVRDKIKETNHLTAVGYHFRYADTVKKFQEMLEGTTSGVVLGKWMGSMPEVDWWRRQDQSGGQFNEQTTHIVDLIRFLFGEVTSVYALENNLTNKNPSVTVADVGLFTLTLESGLSVQLTNTSVLPEGTGDIGIKTYTDQGIVEWRLGHVEKRTAAKIEKYLARQNPYRRENEGFLHAVKTGDRSKILSDYEDAWRSFKVAMAAQKSILEGRVVYVSEMDE
ncbi:Gfo/Idh/MocA family oxidoreductase [Gracilibacillus sp. S3-1-1]|uniref:Gfo/Idh/MocA family oxidoreductase n=1 Tax=Gracilibacillus pellucidus TaxID=3095368 RepID=A0ACC6M2T9_9BACI|nr:Gfo/Idh/MocA family oxidoreductase [Gracilibacillus sp. S3-1-1]MDX8045213.1 Gfo/Idh/MocA family oxidoreductase [Gracilibacillus sp. S3-1-1]